MPIILLDITSPTIMPTWVAWVAAVGAPIAALVLAVFTWLIQGKIADGIKGELMAHINALQQEGKQREIRLEQKIDMLMSQIKDDIKAVGLEVKTSASHLRSELGEVKKGLVDLHVSSSTSQAAMHVSLTSGFQNLEKIIELQIKAEVARQIAASGR